jgi:RNase H-like domain found in reverse transcriptase
VAYYNEKLNGVKLNYLVYDLELYAIVKALQHWRHYLLHREFVLFSDHQALAFLQGQHKLSSKHTKWVTSIQEFSFSIKHKSGEINKVADALSRRCALVAAMTVHTLGFEQVQDIIQEDEDFKAIIEAVEGKMRNDYSLHYGYLFRGSCLCIPKPG